jgi:hypothetical protein
METIKPGMTREELLKVFATEGGLSTGLNRTFVSRDCPYFKVDVEFEARFHNNAGSPSTRVDCGCSTTQAREKGARHDH